MKGGNGGHQSEDLSGIRHPGDRRPGPDEASSRRSGRAIGTYFLRTGKRMWRSGRDCRLSSPVLRRGADQGAARHGLRRHGFRDVPTPLLYFAFHKNKEAGVMITGSHNPPEYNGFKMMVGRGNTLRGGDPGDLTDHQGRRVRGRAGAGKRLDIVPEYMDYVARCQARRSSRRRRRRQRHGRRRGRAAVREARLRGDRALLRDGRPLPQPPPRPDRARSHGGPHRQGPRDAGATSASPTTATPTASASWTTGGRLIWGDQLMIVFARDILPRIPGRRSSPKSRLQGPLRRHRQARRQAHHVEDRPLPHQEEDEGGEGRAGRAR